MIKNKLLKTYQQIKDAEEFSKREIGSVELILVSKKQTSDKIKIAYDSGHRVFAENYLQEALIKIDELKALDIKWHYIGSLQKNKIKNIVGNFELIHSVGKIEHLYEISKRSAEKNKTQDILLQVNLVAEESKSGFMKKELDQQINQILKIGSINIRGLMFMPPLFDTQQEFRIFYKKAVDFKREIELKFKSTRHQFSELSMGTTVDFIEAIHCGSTMVRLGRSVFGERK